VSQSSEHGAGTLEIGQFSPPGKRHLVRALDEGERGRQLRGDRHQFIRLQKDFNQQRAERVTWPRIAGRLQ
jgi:hypothetical protein